MSRKRVTLQDAVNTKVKAEAPIADIGVDQNQTWEESKAVREASKAQRAEMFKHKERRRDVRLQYIQQWHAFTGFVLVNSLAAIYSPIQDCDEVFNFWEPTHYMERGNGFQTWEYAPQFALRSWLYPCIHALITLIGRPGAMLFGKPFAFYFLRFVLGIVCAYCESALFAQVSRTLNAKIGLYFAAIIATSSGMFHASVAYLPSSLAMYATMLAMAAFLDWRTGPRSADGIMWLGFSSVLAWPFAGALVIPFMAEESIIAYFTGEWRDVAIRCIYGGSRIICFGIVEFFWDLAFYRKYVCAPLNILWYNVLSTAKGKGPSIFGTEPWHYYIRNLLINFNLWFLLALLAGPLLWYQEFVFRKPATKSSWIRNFTAISPMYFWLIIFIIQPHKEERFMYPIYPAIALNAAITLHLSLIHMGSHGAGAAVLSFVPARIRLLFVIGVAFSAALMGAFRTLGNVEGYGAPLSIYKPLHGTMHHHDTLCLGKEWYRFPSHYFVPRGVRARFVRSEFRGLLPGEFHRPPGGFGLIPGAWLNATGQNDENREDMGRYTRDSHCNYLVDSHLPSTNPTTFEPDRVNDATNWEQLQCLPFLDAASTNVFARLFWVPDWKIIPQKYRRVWGKYCLLKRKGRVTDY